MGRMKTNLLLIICICSGVMVNGQVVINEISAEGRVEIINLGTDIVDLTEYWLCNRPQYDRIGILDIDCGSINLLGGDSLVVQTTTVGTASAGDELGLYSTNSNGFGDAASMVDYVIWGNREGTTRESVAVLAGIWTDGDRASAFSESTSLNYDGDGDLASDFFADSTSLCTSTVDPEPTCELTGTTISLQDSTLNSICIDGDAPINGTFISDAGDGIQSTWLVTDTSLNILSVQDTNVFDLNTGTPGVCQIWEVTHDTTLMGAVIDSNVADLSGCFALSNSITINKLTGADCSGPVDTCDVLGGIISSSDELTVCVGDSLADLINVTIDTSAGTLMSWIITDTALNIIDIPFAPPFDFESSGEGTCLIWHISYESGLMGAAIGQNAGDLTGCFDFSNSITVNRLSGLDCPGACAADGGQILVSDSLTELTICLDDSTSTVDFMLSSASGSNMAWVVTDTALNILSIDSSNQIDFSGTEAGICLVWHVSYEDDAQGLEIGANANDLAGCQSLSNSIRVVRLSGADCSGQMTCDVTASTIQLEDSTQTSICVDDAAVELITVLSNSDSGSTSTWLVTDTSLNILIVSDNNVFDIESAGAGICQIWQVIHDGTLGGAEVDSNASNLSGCFALSDAVTVEKLSGEDCPGGPTCGITGATLMLEDSSNVVNVCAGDGMSDAFNVILDNVGEGNTAWIISDEDGNILAFPLSPPFDFDGAGAGTALLYHLTFENGISGASLGGNVINLEGCFGLSNPITVIREQVNGGQISLPISGDDEVIICDNGSGFTPFDVLLEDAEGQNSQWVLTDTGGVIINFPIGSPFDLEGTGSGTSMLWHLSFQDGLTGLEVGNDANNLSGCFEYSNPITILYNSVDGGVLSANGSDEVTLCLDDAESNELTFMAEGNEGINMTFVVTDKDGVILEISDAATIDFSENDAGVCLVWLLAYNGDIEGAVVDSNANNLMGCFDLSNALTVTRVTGEDCPTPCIADGGIATIQDGPSEIVICADDGLSDLFEVTVTGASGTNMAIVITDALGEIIGLPGSNNVDLEGSGAGVCNIYNIAYEDDVELPTLGGNIDDINGCYNLSNPIVITRLGGEDCPFVCEIEAGELETANETTEETFCTDDGEDDIVNVVQEGATGEDNYYVLTDAASNIVDIAMGSDFNFEGSGSGTALIWHLTKTGSLSGLNVGDNTSGIMGCFELSNSITINTITGVECLPPCTTDGGDVMYLDNTNEDEYCNGDVRFTITHVSEADPELDYFYIVTDEEDNILEIRNSADGGDFDFSRMANSVSHVWGWSTDGSITPEVGSSISTLEEGCNVLSGDFVNVTIVNGGACDVECHPPRDIRISPTGGNRYKVRWDRVNEAESYIMEVGFEGVPTSFAQVPISRRKVTLTVPEGRIVVIRIMAVCPGGEMSEFTIDFTIDNTGKSKRPKAGDRIEVSELDIEEDGHVYPNPAVDRLQVWYDGDGADGQLSVISQDGRQVMRQVLSGDIEFHTIDINELNSGLYLLMVHADGQIVVHEKFIKAR